MYILELPEKCKSSQVGKHRKEKNYKYSLLVVCIDRNKSDIKAPIESRFYHTHARSYNVTWLRFDDFYANGSSFSSGYGSHLDSASLQYALMDCGVKVECLEGKGSQAMETALIELAERMNDKLNLGYSAFRVIKVYG